MIAMNRREFTKSLAVLLTEMVSAGDMPILDYCLRSPYEQKRLFDEGLSKCDGFINKSYHQKGLAADIYLVVELPNNDVVIQFEWDKNKAMKWHLRWQELGGAPMILWDKPHFEAGR